jgi:hypothetical protein
MPIPHYPNALFSGLGSAERHFYACGSAGSDRPQSCGRNSVASDKRARRVPSGARTDSGLCCLLTKIEIMHIPFESPLKALAGPEIFPAQFALSHTAANNTFGTAQTPLLMPSQTCRRWFHPSTPLHKPYSRSRELLSPFCAAKSQASQPRRNSPR